jgi:chaperonin GroEL
MAKKLSHKQDALVSLKKGINQVAEAVTATMGPKGRTVVLDRGRMAPPVVTKDGVSVAKEIELEDVVENIGAQMIKQAAIKTNNVAGDGTTTSTLLTQILVNESIKNVTAGTSPQPIKAGIEKGMDAVVEFLKDKLALKVEGKESIAQVASISANDKEIGQTIADLMDEVGEHGVITVEHGQTLGIETEVVKGMQFDKGYVSPAMVTDPQKMIAEVHDAKVLVTTDKVSSTNTLIPIIEKLAASGESTLVIIADTIEGNALKTLVINTLQGNFRTLAISAPGFGDRRKDMLQDIATVLGANVVSEEAGKKLEDAELSDLGNAEKVTSTDDTTTIIGGRGEKEEIDERVKTINLQIDNNKNEYEKERLMERRAKLDGGVGVIKVGGATEIEIKEKRDRIDDALAATKAATEEGFVVGGGVALVRCAEALDKLKVSDDEKIGVNILRRSLEEPLRKIASNAAKDGSVVVEQVKQSESMCGYNAATDTFEDLVVAGVIDPVKVVRSALQNAVSVAGMVLSTEVVVSNLEEK